MPKNRPGKRGRSRSAKKDAPAAQKSKTTTGAETESAEGQGVAEAEEQIVPSLGTTGGKTPTGADEPVGQSVPPPSTTIQADSTGDQPSTGEKTGGGETVEEIIPSEQGGSKGVDQPSTVDQQIGGDSVGVNTSPEQGGGEVGVAQGVSSDLGGSKEVVSESTPPPPTTTDATEESIVAAGSKSTEDLPITETTVGSLQPFDETNAPSDETNAPILAATATTAVQSTTEKEPQKIIDREAFHASQPIAGTKRPQRGKTLPLRSSRQSSAKQASTTTDQEKLPASTAQVNLDKELRDTDSSSDESSDEVNIPQKGGDVNLYDQMFAIMPRFLPRNNWNKDGMSNKSLDIFHQAKERHKKDVQDNYDWINFKAPRVDKQAAIKAYQSKYTFFEGFIPSHTLQSQSKYSLPSVVQNRMKTYHPHDIAMDHPLCNIPIEMDWLNKPVSVLVNKINIAMRRPPTRSSMDDYRSGKDIYLHAAYRDASEFVTVEYDDVELIDVVVDDPSKKMWHCSDVLKSNMLRHAVIGACNEAYGSTSTSVPSFLKDVSLEEAQQPIQFLGFVSLFTTPASDRVVAFKLHSFLIYKYDERKDCTIIEAMVTETHLYGTSAPERLMQVLQLLQSSFVNTTHIRFEGMQEAGDETLFALQCLGFSSEHVSTRKTPKNKPDCFYRRSLMDITVCTNRILWVRFGSLMSLPEEMADEGKIALLNFACSIVSSLLFNQIDAEPSIGLKLNDKGLRAKVEKWLDSQQTPVDVNNLHNFALQVAMKAVWVPLSIFTHAIVNRFKMRNKKTSIQNLPIFHETTMELIQFVTVNLTRVSPYHDRFVGDSHRCTLYCSKCESFFGITDTIAKVLTEAPFAILYHYGLELPETLPDSGKNLTEEELLNRRMSLSMPMHTMSPHLNDVGPEVTKKQAKYERCIYGADDCTFELEDVNKNRYYLHNMAEAMRIDAFFSGDDQTRHYNTTAMLFSIFEVGLYG